MASSLYVLHNSLWAINWSWRMVSSGMLRRVALVRADVSEELSPSFIRVTRIGELGTTLAATSNRHTLWRNNLLVADVPLLLVSRTIPYLSYQLLTATAHSDRTAGVLQLQLLTAAGYNVVAWTMQEMSFPLLLCSHIVMDTCLFCRTIT
jgi:hypothetical protein